MLVSGRKNCKHPNRCLSNHGHVDVLLTAVRGRSLWLTPLLGNRVRHTNQPLNPPQGIHPCLWVANNRSLQAQRQVGEHMTLIIGKVISHWRQITVVLCRMITPDWHRTQHQKNATEIPLVSVALRLCQYVLLRMLTKKGGS